MKRPRGKKAGLKASPGGSGGKGLPEIRTISVWNDYSSERKVVHGQIPRRLKDTGWGRKRSLLLGPLKRSTWDGTRRSRMKRTTGFWGKGELYMVETTVVEGKSFEKYLTHGKKKRWLP